MRRSELKPGKPLERRTPLARSAGPRVSSLKSTTDGKGKGRDKKRGKNAEREFRQRVLDGPCVMCREFKVPLGYRLAFDSQFRQLDPHHLIRKQTLRAEGLGEHVNDHRNGAPVCRYHHGRHHAYIERIPRSLLPVAVFEFAAELGLEAILDREYPVVEQHPLNNAIGQEAA